MWTFEVVSHRVDIIDYLVPMWHVCSNKSHFAICFLSCKDDLGHTHKLYMDISYTPLVLWQLVINCVVLFRIILTLGSCAQLLYFLPRICPCGLDSHLSSLLLLDLLISLEPCWCFDKHDWANPTFVHFVFKCKILNGALILGELSYVY